MTKYQKYKLTMLAIFGFLFLLIMYDYSTNGRYIIGEESFIIFDTKTGTIYTPQNKIKLEEFSKSEKKK